MDKIDLLITNGVIVLENGLTKANIAIKDGKIVGIFDKNIAINSKKNIDAKGRIVMPGCVDSHSHIWEPTDFEYREDFYTGTCAAATGGITTIVEMPLSVPPVKDRESFKNRYDIANSKSVVDFSLWGAFIKESADKFSELNDLGCVAYKAFLSHASDEYPRVDDYNLLMGMESIAKFNGLVGVHAENFQITDGFEKAIGSITRGSDHERTRPEIAEIEAISRAILFAKHTGARLHICHIATANAYELIKRAKADRVDITVETCPHYLTLSTVDLDNKGGFAKCNPPLRSEENKEKLWQLIKDNKIDCIGSDHTPYTDEDRLKHDDIFKMPPGIGGIDLLIPLMISEGYNKRAVSIVDIAKITATNFAKIIGIYPTKGAINLGADADVIIVDVNEKWIYDPLKSYAKSKCVNSPYAGMEITGRVKTTIVRGNVVYDGETITGKQGCGKYIRP